MAHTTPDAAPDKGRRRFLGAVATGLAALIGWPIVRSATRDDPTGTTLAQETTTTGAPSTTAAPATSAAPSTTGAPVTSATTTTTSPTEVAGATVTTSPGTTAAPGTTAPRATTTTTQPAATTTQPATGTLGLAVLEKAAWSDTPDGTGFRVQNQINAITIHHTAVVLQDNRNAPNRFRQHEAYHRSQGWPDIAYHMLIDRNGNVYEGRPLWAIGDTFTNYDPTGHFLPALEGDFDNQAPTEAQVLTLATVVAWAVNHYGLGFSVVKGHRDLAATSCPGDALYTIITGQDFANQVANRKARGVELTRLTGQAAADIVASIEA